MIYIKINNSKHSVALVAVALILFLALISSASATLLTSPTTSKIILPSNNLPKVFGINPDFTFCPDFPRFFINPVSGNPGYTEPIYFMDKSVSTWPIKYWLWEIGDDTIYLGDGSVSLPKNPPAYTYSGPWINFIKVTLTVKDVYGSTSTVTKYVPLCHTNEYPN
jgi:hypothetical protein